MSRSTKRSARTGQTTRNLERVILSLKGLVGRATEPAWLVVPDTSTIVRGVIGRSGQPSQQLLEAAVGGLYLPVVSDHLRDEVAEVLQRPKFGFSIAEAEAVLDPFWKVSRFVEPATYDEAYLRFVHDPNDVFLIQTAAATFNHSDLSDRKHQFIVSGDAKAFPSGRNWASFKCCSARELWDLLETAIA